MMWVVGGIEGRGEGRVIGRRVKLFSVDGREEDTDEDDQFFFGVRVVVIGDVERSPKKFERLSTLTAEDPHAKKTSRNNMLLQRYSQIISSRIRLETRYESQTSVSTAATCQISPKWSPTNCADDILYCL